MKIILFLKIIPVAKMALEYIAHLKKQITKRLKRQDSGKHFIIITYQINLIIQIYKIK